MSRHGARLAHAAWAVQATLPLLHRAPAAVTVKMPPIDEGARKEARIE
jgi:hypothetical protein